MPQLYIEFAGGNENSITLDAINKAEKFSSDCFENLGQHAVDRVCVLLLSLSS
jgi:hypothetical protein